MKFNILTVFILCFIFPNLYSVWLENGTPVCTNSANQYEPKITSRMMNGYLYIAWRDYRNDSYGDLYAQRVDGDGNLGWITDGLGICVNGNNEVGSFSVSHRDLGGLVAVWTDERSISPAVYEVYGRCVSQGGGTVWGGSNGTNISLMGDKNELGPKISATSGSVHYVAWRYGTPGGGTRGIIAARVNSNGSVAWRTEIESDTLSFYVRGVVWDGTNMYVLYSKSSTYKLACLNSTGSLLWTKILSFRGREIISDGSGGVYIAGWVDGTDGWPDIALMRVSSSGSTVWGPIVVCDAPYQQGADVELASDGAGGVIVVWMDFRSGNFQSGSIYAQRVSSSGTPLWQTNGVAITSGTINGLAGGTEGLAVVEDEAGGVFIAWEDYRNGNLDIYAVRIDGNGNPTGNWSAEGEPVCTANGEQQLDGAWGTDRGIARISGENAAIVVWEDYRNGNADIYMAKLGPNGVVIDDTTPPSPFSLISPPDSSFIPNLRPTFIWHKATDNRGIKNYELFIDNMSEAIVSDTQFTLTQDLSEGYHSWFVVAYDSAGNFTNSNETWVFAIDTTSPSAVSLIQPSNNSYLNASTVTFIWSSSNDNFSVDYYNLQCAFDPNFSQGVVDINLQDTFYNSGNLLDSVYYWRVRVVDKAGNQSNWSSVWSFTIDTQTPATPVLYYPVNGVFLSDTQVSFSWSEVTFYQNFPSRFKHLSFRKIRLFSSPVKYIFMIDTSISFTSPIVSDTFDTNQVVLNLSMESKYFWKVKAFDLAGNQSSFSSPDSFGVDITAPLIESTTVWGDTSYMGPFEVRTKVTDNLAGVDSVILVYKRMEDTGWIRVNMNLVGGYYYAADIPPVNQQDDTVKYYIESSDKALPSNFSRDPQSGYYVFVANVVSVKEKMNVPSRFSFFVYSVKNGAIFVLKLPQVSDISLVIYDGQGRKVAEVLKGEYKVGIYRIRFIPEAKGVYFYEIKATHFKNKRGKIIVF